MRRILPLLLLAAVVAASQFLIWREHADVTVTRETLAGNPVDRYEAVGESRGTVIVAHGFAGSREVMQPWGYAMARRGFDTYVLDQPGHGDSDRPLPPWQSADDTGLGENLIAVIDELVAAGRAEPGKIALIGHSMGGAAVTQAAMEDSRIGATVTISSAYLGEIWASRPVNLLSLAAQWDPDWVLEILQNTAAQASDGQGEVGVQYGTFSAGTARQADVVPGQNHISILYDPTVIARAALWIQESLGTGEVVAEALPPFSPWLLLAVAAGIAGTLFTGVLVAGEKPAAYRLAGPQLGMGISAIALAVAAMAATLVTVFLRFSWLHVALMDFLVPYFLVMAAVLAVLRVLWPADFGFSLTQEQSLVGGIGRGLAIFAVYLLLMGTILHLNFTQYLVRPTRLLPTLLMAVALWLYLLQEEGLKRAARAASGRWAWPALGVASKAILLATWLGASLLPNPPLMFPMALPLAGMLMLVLEAASWLFGRLYLPPATAATFAALVVAWSVGSLFPIL